MPRPKCFPSSSIGINVDISHHFLDRPETVSITWDDAFFLGSLIEDKAWFKVHMGCEPPEVLNYVDRLIQIHNYYDLILTWDDRVLEQCKNAKFLTESCCSWIDRKSGGTPPEINFNMLMDNYAGCDASKKRLEVSFLTSSKGFTKGHRLRQEIYERLPESVGALKVWKHRSPPRIDDKRVMLEPVMFSICPENTQHNGYYSEKLVDCLVSKTIPVYWGCTNIERHFNTNGIVLFRDCNDLMGKLQTLTPEFYNSRKEAIEENCQIALKSVRQWDLIEQYVTEGIQKKHTLQETAFTMPQLPEQIRRIHRPIRRTL